MKKYLTIGICGALCWWRFTVTPRLDLPTEVGILEAVAHFAMGWFLCVWVNIRKPWDYYGNLHTYGNPSPEVPWPGSWVAAIPYGLITWVWLYTRQWLYFLAFLIPSLFELFMVIYQLKNK